MGHSGGEAVIAASLRAREVEVTVVAPDERPLAKILGPELGDLTG